MRGTSRIHNGLSKPLEDKLSNAVAPLRYPGSSPLWSSVVVRRWHLSAASSPSQPSLHRKLAIVTTLTHYLRNFHVPNSSMGTVPYVHTILSTRIFVRSSTRIGASNEG